MTDHDAAGAGSSILVTGASGQVGRELLRELSPLGRIYSPGRGELDLLKPRSIRGVVKRVMPRLVVNAAAYTAVDRAESEAAACMAVNATAPQVLAESAQSVGALFVHFSTDYVFDGTKRTPYVETDLPAPLNVYGASKLAGEQAVQGVGGAHIIFRTSWVYGAHGSNFLRTVQRLARAGTELRIVDDQIGAPTWSRSIAIVTALVIREVLRAEASPNSPYGIYHLTSGGETSWYRFARAILERDPRVHEPSCPVVVPIATEDYQTPARRPRYSLLDNSKLRERFGLALPDWESQLDMALADAYREVPAVG